MFKDIIGNDKVKQKLEKSIELNRVSHSYMFIGTNGIGKKIIAKEFAKSIMCMENNKPCNLCKSCMEFNSNSNPDFLCIEPIDGKNIKIDQIRQLQTKIIEKPIISNKKIYIIDDAEKMTKEAQNSLLKTLEEPPEYMVIILIGTNEDAFLSTIKSRCTIIHFSKLRAEELKAYMKKEKILVSDNILDLAEGSISKALKLKEKEDIYINIYDILKSIDRLNIIDVIKKLDVLYKSKEDILEILDCINIMLLRLSKINFKYVECINIVENTKKRLNANSNYDMCIDNLLFNILGVFNEENNRC